MTQPITDPNALAAIKTWADQIAFIREDGIQVTYSEKSIPAVKAAHLAMLRAILKAYRVAVRPASTTDQKGQ